MYTDPADPWSWGAEPAQRRLEVEFGDQVAFTYVMAGLAREFRHPHKTMRDVMDAGEATGMPVDPRLWLDGPPVSSYPACQGVKAAAEQGLEGRYLRVLREGLMVDRRKLDSADALVDAAHHVPGLDVERFGIDLRSDAIVEAFGADLERGRETLLPSFDVRGETDAAAGPRRVQGHHVAPLREAVLAAGAEPAGALPGAEEVVRRFGRVATAEVAAACDLHGPRAAAELWRLAAEWRVRALTGVLWSPE